jgi:DNA gyrase subunit B
MPEVIENGYLYIAQPPLFKVKKGKKERYVQNETELQDMLFDIAADEVELSIGEKLLKGKSLLPVLKRISSYEKLIDWFIRRRRDPEVLAYLMKKNISKDFFKNKKNLEDLVEIIQNSFKEVKKSEIVYDEEHESYTVQLRRHNFRVNLDYNFITAAAFLSIL